MFSSKNKKNATPIFVFIDGGYFCFNRYHSVLKWWKNIYPERLDVLNDPIQHEEFVQKFRESFVNNVQKIIHTVRNYLNDEPTLIVGKDCKREHIWRTQLFPQYKSNRNKEGFMGKPLIKLAYDENLFIKGGANMVLKHTKLEADDCIAICIKQLLQKYPHSRHVVITSDKDYLQLAGDNVEIFDMSFYKLTDMKTSFNDPECDLFCKILTGDRSDNIPSVFPKCGPKTALKMFENRNLLTKKLKESEEYQNQYELNRRLIDFDYIPEHLENEFIQNYELY
jgi:5'-3' exonuclease